MKLHIKPYSKEMEPAVSEFNRHLKTGGITFQFPESCTPAWLPHIPGRKIFQKYYLAVENYSIVRGGYILKHQEFFVNGQVMSVGNYQLPLSEGTMNKAYNLIGIKLLKNALKYCPLLYSLGMGSMDKPLPRLLDAFGWNLTAVPFYYKIVNPYNFLRNISALRETRIRRIFLDALAMTGLGWIAIKLVNILLQLKKVRNIPTLIEKVDRFGDWADWLWIECQRNFSFSAVRDQESLNILYPKQEERFIKLRISVNHKIIGWSVLLDTSMMKHKQFGNMRVGTLVDCLALKHREVDVIEATTIYLKRYGIDLIVSNQLHDAYCTALKKSGFLRGPSNFIFATSRRLTELLEPFDINVAYMHINRSDGDGPIHL